MGATRRGSSPVPFSDSMVNERPNGKTSSAINSHLRIGGQSAADKINTQLTLKSQQVIIKPKFENEKS